MRLILMVNADKWRCKRLKMGNVTGKSADKTDLLIRISGVQQRLIHENTEGGETQ